MPVRVARRADRRRLDRPRHRRRRHAVRGRVTTAAYHPATRRWHLISPTLPPRHPPGTSPWSAHRDRLILWSFWDRVRNVQAQASDRRRGRRLALGRRAWRQRHRALAAGTRLSPLRSSPAAQSCSRPAASGVAGDAARRRWLRAPATSPTPATLAVQRSPPGPLGRGRTSVHLDRPRHHRRQISFPEVTGPAHPARLRSRHGAYDPPPRAGTALPSRLATPHWPPRRSGQAASSCC